jgi:hypothetical protein
MKKIRPFITRVILVCLFLVPLLAGCGTIPVPTRSVRVGEAEPLGSCADFFALLDKRIKESKVIDPGVFRVKGWSGISSGLWVLFLQEPCANGDVKP